MASEPNSEYHVLFLQLLDLVGAEREHSAENFVVVLTENRRGRSQRARRAAHAMLESLVRRRPHLLVLEPMPEAERIEVVVLVDVDAVLDRVSGDSGALQLRGEILRVVRARKRADELIDRRTILNARGRSRECGIGRRRAQNREHRAPLLVTRDGDRNPSLVAVLVGASVST